MTNYHVIKDKSRGDWYAKRENSQRISGRAGTQKEAEKMAKDMCGNSGGGEVRIHRPDGPIRDSDTVKPGNDPCPPRDKKY